MVPVYCNSCGKHHSRCGCSGPSMSSLLFDIWGSVTWPFSGIDVVFWRFVEWLSFLGK